MTARNEPDAPAMRHNLGEDVLAFAIGTSICALGLQILTSLGLVTGQTAGLAVLISYVTGYSFGLVFFIVNLPFYWLAWTRMGARFTIKSFIAVGILSVVADYMPLVIRFETIQLLPGALMMGTLIGMGLLAIFRHGGSLGGVGILALYIQDKTGFRAGLVQLAFDAVLFLAALLVLDPMLVLYSLIGAVVVNVTIALNHRRDRYIAR